MSEVLDKTSASSSKKMLDVLDTVTFFGEMLHCFLESFREDEDTTILVKELIYGGYEKVLIGFLGLRSLVEGLRTTELKNSPYGSEKMLDVHDVARMEASLSNSLKMIDVYLDYRRIYLWREITLDHLYSIDVMEFLKLELGIETSIRQNAWNKLTPMDHSRLRTTFECLRTKDLGSLKEDLNLLEIKYIYHLGKSESRYDECQKLLREVDVDEVHISVRRNQLLAECSLIKAIIIKRKSGSYKPDSKCFELMKFLAESRFSKGLARCIGLQKVMPDHHSLSYLKPCYNGYLKRLKHDFDEIYVLRKPYKLKNVKSYKMLDGLLEKTKMVRAKELKYILCCFDHDMPGIQMKWLRLVCQHGARVVDCDHERIERKHYLDFIEDVQRNVHVSRDRDRCSSDQTAMDLTDTTITVIIEDLM